MWKPLRGKATLRVDEAYPAHPLGHSAKAWLVTERGIGNVHIEEFEDEAACKHRAESQTFNIGFSVKPCHVIFAVRRNSIVEVAAGGVGLAHATCAYHGSRWLKQHYGGGL